MAKRLYDEDGSLYKDEDDDDFSGFEVSDERSIFLNSNKNAEEDELPICSEIPKNELKAILFKPSSSLCEGDEVGLFISERIGDVDGNTVSDYTGGILVDGKMAGEFKPPLIEKIYSKWRGFFATAKVTQDSNPVMVTIYFDEIEKQGSTKI